MSLGGLEPLDPVEATDMYIDHRQTELRDETLSAHYYRLKQFYEWCQKTRITNLNELSPRDLHRYRAYRLNEQDNAVTTVRGDLFTLKKFLQFCESIQAVPKGLSEYIDIPTVSADENTSDETISPDRATRILEHYEKYEYASRTHALFALTWHIGCRLGALRSLDLKHLHLDPEGTDEIDGPFIEIRHHPDQGTPLKNGTSGERDVNISTEIAEILHDYISVNRNEVIDEYGREPVFTTVNGRMSRSAIRHTFYRITRPCMYVECPHDRDPETCEALEAGRESLCPSSRAPHAVRTGAITHMRRIGIDPDVISDRVNATEEIIEQHYDKTTVREKTGLRRNQLTDLL